MTRVRMNGYYHVIPVDDLREHEPFVSCWCRPVPDIEEETILLHNALDRRELYETGQLPLQ